MRVCVFSLFAGVEVKMGIVVISNATIPGGTAPIQAAHWLIQNRDISER